MEQEILTFKNFAASPFVETEETKEIKQYAKKLGQLDDFKDLKLYFVQYNDTDTLRDKVKLVDFYEQTKRKSLSIISGFLPYSGMYNFFTNKIMIFLDNQIKYGKIKYISVHLSKLKMEMHKDLNYLKKTCCSILKTMYHEKKHHMQKEVKDNSFESIMYQIEMNLKASLYGTAKYLRHHDSWYLEIDANNYGVNKTLEYYRNNPNDDHVDLEYLQHLQKRYESDELTYDFDAFFTAYNIYREKIPFYSQYRNMLSNIFLKDRDMAWHKVLYGDKKRLKNVEEILNDPLINELDPKFINYVLTSKYLNKNINYDNLNYETLARLSTEFKNRLNGILHIAKDESNLSIRKRDLIRLKGDIEYYRSKISLLQSKIDSYSETKTR